MIVIILFSIWFIIGMTAIRLYDEASYDSVTEMMHDLFDLFNEFELFGYLFDSILAFLSFALWPLTMVLAWANKKLTT